MDYVYTFHQRPKVLPSSSGVKITKYCYLDEKTKKVKEKSTNMHEKIQSAKSETDYINLIEQGVRLNERNNRNYADISDLAGVGPAELADLCARASKAYSDSVAALRAAHETSKDPINKARENTPKTVGEIQPQSNEKGDTI